MRQLAGAIDLHSSSLGPSLPSHRCSIPVPHTQILIWLGSPTLPGVAQVGGLESLRGPPTFAVYDRIYVLVLRVSMTHDNEHVNTHWHYLLSSEDMSGQFDSI